MDVDLNDIDDKLKQIKPNELDCLQQALIDAKSAEGTRRSASICYIFHRLTYSFWSYPDDIAIAQAINEIEAELNEDESAHRTSIFDADGVDVDLNEIDADLQQISTKEIDFENQGKKDLTSAEGAWSNLPAPAP